MAIIQTLAPIVLQPKKSLRRRIEATRFFKIITSPKTTLALGATLLGLIAAPATAAIALRAAPSFASKLIPRTPLGAVKAVAAVGLVSGLGVSGVKKVTKKVFTTSQKAGEIIAGDRPPADILGITKGQTLKEKVITGLKAAGLVGAAAAVAIGGAAAIKKGSQILTERKAKKAATEISSKSELAKLGFTDPQPVGLGGIPVAVPGIRPIEAPDATNGVKPISNIIQIQVS